MKTILAVAVAFLMVLGMASCSRDSGKPGRLARPISDTQLKQELTTLSDTLTGKWNVMMTSDSVKIQQMEELLAALPPAVMPPQQRADLQKSIRRLPTLRYDRRTVRNSSRIDAYDIAHDSVWNALRAFLPTDGPSGLARVDSLYQSISTLHNETVFYRGRYDKTAIEMNTLLRRYKKRLPNLGKPYDTLQPAPLFQWIEKPDSSAQANQ
ncbi:MULTISPECIES: hypothetical protein [Rufibacter]|uniref:Pimeloyl-ACP methyl ester carboxylesterase n=1 Tax=Rufibacter quisquiliarum TaxID=1549639 RepID=A0A839GLF6_9BACT|nr:MULTISPECIES: hypothetical protein [Rufibacter]MBA9075806.1 pimeloyl-ACP methyl ester carboxylesterase [Rufibacter quisquiliarum]